MEQNHVCLAVLLGIWPGVPFFHHYKEPAKTRQHIWRMNWNNITEKAPMTTHIRLLVTTRRFRPLSGDEASDTLKVSYRVTVRREDWSARTDEATLAATSLHRAPVVKQRRRFRSHRPSNVYYVDGAPARSSKLWGRRAPAEGSHDPAIFSVDQKDPEAFSLTWTDHGGLRRGSHNVPFQYLRGKWNHRRIHYLQQAISYRDKRAQANCDSLGTHPQFCSPGGQEYDLEDVERTHSACRS